SRVQRNSPRATLKSFAKTLRLDEKEEISVGIKMQVFDRMTIPIRRVWTGVATRFGVRK
ncbi:hypothetical protein Gorai_016413, partial [Gossypium raimondii]|nr:hypothetical protein [Gossypium raimondii]